MTQLEFIDLVNLNLDDFSNIVPSKVREVEIALSYEVYANRSVIETQQSLITNLLKFMPKNRGWVGNIDIGTLTPSFTIGGDTVGVVSDSSGTGTSIFTVEFANEMPSMNYEVDLNIELNTGSMGFSGIYGIPYKKINETKFQVQISEAVGVTQDFKLHYKITSLD